MLKVVPAKCTLSNVSCIKKILLGLDSLDEAVRMGVEMVNFDVVRRVVGTNSFDDLIVVEFVAIAVDRNRVTYINIE